MQGRGAVLAHGIDSRASVNQHLRHRHTPGRGTLSRKPERRIATIAIGFLLVSRIVVHARVKELCNTTNIPPTRSKMNLIKTTVRLTLG